MIKVKFMNRADKIFSYLMELLSIIGLVRLVEFFEDRYWLNLLYVCILFLLITRVRRRIKRNI